MMINKIQKARIQEFIPVFQKYLEAGKREADIEERRERTEKYRELLSLDSIEQMDELIFGQVVSSLWASLIWGNKGYLVDKLIEDNGLPKLKSWFKELLWGKGNIAARYDAFRENIKGFGSGMLTELLTLIHPDEFGLWNVKARQALIILGFEDEFPIVKKAQISGHEYEEFLALLREIQSELTQYGLSDLNLFGIDYFLYEVWNTGWKKKEVTIADVAPTSEEEITDFDHNDIIEQLLSIGQWLGFEVHKEKMVATGARVDALWQARISTLGVVTYVFEVQRKGSHDSLIINLQKAQNNPSVQKLIIVALPSEIEKIRGEIKDLPEVFRKLVGFMDVNEVMRATELVNELSGIINKLELVRSEFSF